MSAFAVFTPADQAGSALGCRSRYRRSPRCVIPPGAASS